MTKLEYWKKRCEAAETYSIAKGVPSLSRPDIEILYDEWHKLVNTPEPEDCKHSNVKSVYCHGELFFCSACGVYIK